MIYRIATILTSAWVTSGTMSLLNVFYNIETFENYALSLLFYIAIFLTLREIRGDI